MSDLISRQAAIDALCRIDEYNVRSIGKIRNLPSAQPQQKTGKWLDNPITAHSLAKHCSRCGYVCLWYDSITGARFQYCPSCGALMGGKNDEDD